jgi:hypothetical protein
MRAKSARWAIVLGAALGALALVAACSSGDDTVAGKVNPAGPGGQDATTTDSPADLPDTLLPPGAPLCNKYPNGPQLVTKITADLLTAVSADCRIDAYFVAPKSGAAHLSQCLEKQIGNYFQCPGVVYDTDLAGKPCRSMLEAHKNLAAPLRSADFDAFIQDFITVMKANGISTADISAVLPTFQGTKTAIVENPRGIGNSQCTCPNDITPDGGYCGADAGIDANDAGDGGTDGAADAANDGG